MNPTKEAKTAAALFQICHERGWLAELTPSTITAQELSAFEAQEALQLPTFYKEYLTAGQLPGEMFDICGIAWHADELSPLWLTLYGVHNIAELTEYLCFFREDAVEFRQTAPAACAHLLPIGDWGAGWGPLCLDLTKDEDLVDADDEDTWSLVWFDHEYFNWTEDYGAEDGLLHGSPAAPNLRTLLEWYFCGALEAEFEAENQVKVSCARLHDHDFCSTYWEDRWKEAQD